LSPNAPHSAKNYLYALSPAKKNSKLPHQGPDLQDSLFLGAPSLDFSSGNGVQVPSLFNTSGGLTDFINWDNNQQQISLLSRGKTFISVRSMS
jgi:hypothetical protein